MPDNEDDEKEEKEEKIIKMEYKGQKSEEIIFSSISEYKIEPLIKKYTTNIFFLLVIPDKFKNLIQLTTYNKITRYIEDSYYILYSFHFISENKTKKLGDDLSQILVQVPVRKSTEKLSIIMEIDGPGDHYRAEIRKKEEIENFFYVNNVFYALNYYKPSDDEVFELFLNFFFDKNNNRDDTIKINLIQSLIYYIKYSSYVTLSGNIILQFIKYCFNYGIMPEKLHHIKITKSDTPINKEFYTIHNDINNLDIEDNEKIEFIYVIIKIFILYDRNHLASIIKQENNEIYIVAILNLLIQKKIRITDVAFASDEDSIFLQNSLLDISESLKEINIVLSLSFGLTKCLKFLVEKFIIINKIIEKKERHFFRNVTLDLPSIEYDANFDDIKKLILELIKISKQNKSKIIDFEQLIIDLINFYSNKTLEDFLKIRELADKLESEELMDEDYVEKYKKLVHKKGVKLIQEHKMSIEEIMEFIFNQDEYYFKKEYKNKIDPNIFKYISITDEDKNYLENIQVLKKRKVWELFDKCSDAKKIGFYEAFLDQIKKILELKNIFELFPDDVIDKNFNKLIGSKIQEISLTILDEKEENFTQIFDIIKIYISFCEKNKVSIIIPELNYEFNSKLYLYLLKDNELKNFVINQLKKDIISFFIEEKNVLVEDIISLLLLSHKTELCTDLLNNMDFMVIYKEEFYLKEETRNFILFKLFLEKCNNIITNEKKTAYVKQTLTMKDKISNDLQKLKIKFDIINNIFDEGDLLYKRILLIIGEKTDSIHEEMREILQECRNKISKFEKIEEYYNTFFSYSKQEVINILKGVIYNLKKTDLCELVKMDENDIVKEKEKFNYKDSIKEAENLKYKYSLFFMPIYKIIYMNENFEKSEIDMLNQAIKAFETTMTKIILQRQSKNPFFEIEYIGEIMKVIRSKSNGLKDEINFINQEFIKLNKAQYIQNNLLDDLINFSNKEKIYRLIDGIIYFVNTFNQIKIIKITDFLQTLDRNLLKLNDKKISGEEIQKINEFLLSLNYDITKETSLINFYKIFKGKEDALSFIKKIKDSNLEIRNLNEFIDENENSQLQVNDIDNLLDVFTFFNNLIEDKNITTDENFHNQFKKNFEENKYIAIKMQGYLSCYGEIVQLYQLYDENSEMTIEKISNILENSKVEIYEEKNEIFMFKVLYKNLKGELVHLTPNELDELKNKLLISSTNSSKLKKEKGKEDIQKKDLTNAFKKLLDDIKDITDVLNNLIKAGYPYVINLNLKVEKAVAYDEANNKKILKDIIVDYREIIKNYKSLIKKGYAKFPLLRLFYGKQFIQLYKQAKNKNNKDDDISHLINSIALNKIKQFDIKYEYDENKDNIENINNYLEELFFINKANINEIQESNKVLPESKLSPGLYKLERKFDNSELNVNILNIYINLTGNIPLINTLLICNEETSVEKLKSFLYRAFFNKEPVLYVIAHLECLELSIIQKFIKDLNFLYNKLNRVVRSYLIIIYQEENSGLGRELKKIISDKNILNNYFLKESSKNNNLFNETELYSSKYAGYGKSTEIRYKIKDNHGIYNYLPIGGTFNRDYVIQNLQNLEIDFKKNKNYLHIDLSDTDNEDLMNQILFNLLILRCIDSKEKIFYLGNKIKIFIEIPTGFTNFEEKYKILQLFRKTYIQQLPPLRLEEDVYYIFESPISIVAETLYFYENGMISNQNINIQQRITRSAYQCEEIINRYFTGKNNNYYQKNNFIKILSVQFTKFCNNIYFNMENTNDMNRETIRKTRPLIIKNFISLTKVFTCSPYDSILLGQNESLKYQDKSNKNKNKESILVSLAKDKKEIFSFEKIKPSLVFFNKDGQSLSIITNANKNDAEYQQLKALWNSQNNPGVKQQLELINYKNLSHDKLIVEIKSLFSLDRMSAEEIKKICETSGNYIFVSDNYIKMVRILLNIEAKIPTILLGETGVGKTKLIEILSSLYGNGKSRWKILQIHAGITDQDIVDFIERITQEAIDDNVLDDYTWVFLDEINTCNSLGLITEIMCNHTYLGKKINPNFIFIGACNPYRLMTKKMRESGLVYYNMKDDNKLNNLVYTVNPLPHSLLNFVFDFDMLRPKDEKKYIANMIRSMISEIKDKGLIPEINEKVLEEITEKMITTVVMCHIFIRDIYDISSVSMREIRRFGIFFQFFINYFNSDEGSFIADSAKKMLFSLNISLYLCYYLRLNDKKDRNKLAKDLDPFFNNNNFIKFPEFEIKKITEQMYIEKGKGIALNRALRENLFTIFMCITNNVPLIIVGKPGTSKSLSFQILYNTMKGEYSESKFFKDKGKLYRYYYQGSETSTSKGIEKVFQKAMKAQANNKNKNIITLVFFDEMGLAERSSNNPLKIIHYLLEKDNEDSVPFLGISNWKLDASKINRALSLTITDYDIEDLKETAISIADALDTDLCDKYKEFFEILAKTYYEYVQYNQNNKIENKDFHGNRDFYNLIKNAIYELIIMVEKKGEKKFKKKENKYLTDIGITCLERNFGGLEDSTNIIKDIFKKEFEYNYDESYYLKKKKSIVDIIKRNIEDPNGRYLMLISEGNDASDIIKYVLKFIKKNYIELVGSKYKNDIKSGRYSEEILNKIKYIMETDNILILRDLDIIYPSLYDLFNQNFTCMGDKKFARIAFEYAKISSEVNINFRVIIIVNKIKIEELKLDPPFLNRFEKHIINFRMLLNEKDLEISKKIMNYFSAISSYNNNKKLKLDLEKLMINCQSHSIEGLIYKIKNEELADISDSKYEKMLIKKIFEKVTPTFCQDIIASIIFSKIDKKFREYNEIVLDIYQKKKCPNFNAFFEKIDLRKNIIYTFSKITEEIFNESTTLENIFGEFKQETTEIAMIESVKSEGDLETLLKTFTNSMKKLLIFKFSEADIDKINLVDHIINNYEYENGQLKEKIILLIIHRQRHLKSTLKKEKNIYPDFIPLINDDYYQIFIDNLQGKEIYDITKIEANKAQAILKEFISKTNFIENNLFTVLSYIKFNILYETEEFNNKNCIAVLSSKILENEELKKMLIKNIEYQSELKKDIINEVFLSNVIEVNDVDFFEVLNSFLKSNVCKLLLNIIFFLLKQHVLIPILDTKNFENFKNISFFNDLITDEFNKKDFNFVPQIKTLINSNSAIIYNNLQIPESKIFLEKINTYINNEIYNRYVENEDSLRKKYNDEQEIKNIIEKYNSELQRLEENIKVEIDKYEFFKNIYDKKKNILKKLLLEDYLRFFVIKFLEKNVIDYKINEHILSFLIIILKLKFFGTNINEYKFDNSQEEFIKILLFTIGYKNDIYILFTIFTQVIKYFPEIEKNIIRILTDNKMVYEISERNKEYTKIVNFVFFIIIEALSRAILLYSVDLIHFDKNKFYEYFNTFTVMEANLQNLNRKYYLFNKELYNIGSIIKIHSSYKYNFDKFEKNYDKIIQNLLKQSDCLYENDYNHLYDIILDLNEIFNDTFEEKNEEYINLMFIVFLRQYEISNDEEIRIKLIGNFLNNPLLIKQSKIFLYDTLKEIKPEYCEKEMTDKKKKCLEDFMNIDNNKLIKYKNLFNVYNNIKSNEFDEIILYIFETNCQSYFINIINKHNNQFNKECCDELLMNISLDYLNKAIKYLYDIEQNENNDFNINNKLIKFLAIAYIKTYVYFYVEINYKNFKIVDFDDINDIFNYKLDKKNLLKNINVIYIWKKYCKKFENFQKFETFKFSDKKIPLYKAFFKKLDEEKKEDKSTYIFKESFIPKKLDKLYSEISSEFAVNNMKMNLNFEEINQNFDVFYCFLVNTLLSYLYSNNREYYLQKLNNVYHLTSNKIFFNTNGNLLYNNLLLNLDNSIFKKISDHPLNQPDFEILLYSFRYVFSTLSNNNNNTFFKKNLFYNNILTKDSFKYINENYIPGSFPFINEFIKSYNDLEEKFKKVVSNGQYICKDCGYLYEIPPCTLPYSKGKCPNGHDIGGEDHICCKKDLRVFPNEMDRNRYANSISFEKLLLNEYKKNYVDKFLLQKPKGIIKGYRFNDFERKDYITDVHIITYRTLNFILYSYLIVAFILNFLNEAQMREFLIENLFPHTLFGILKRGWDLLDKELKKIGIENVQIFFNMTFDYISTLMNNLETVDTLEKLKDFEKSVNDYILSIIQDKKNIQEMNNQYKKYNNEILNLNFQRLKEILQQNFDPTLYTNNLYHPDFKFYWLSDIYDINVFAKIFNSNNENKNKYALIDILINSDSNLIKNAKKMKNLSKINKLSNLLLSIYSFKITREKAKIKTLKEELNNIIMNYNEINTQKELSENKFINEYITPFMQSWDNIKSNSVQYKCRILRDLEKGEKPLDMNLDNYLCYFLVDDGDKDGGMFLASAYEHFIEWQNQFIDEIISKNNMSGILNSYISQLEKEINVQDATESEIINIDDKTYEIFNDLISSCSMRNIFNKNDEKINYKNYNDIKYNFDLIEEELGKLIIPGLKKFKKDKIKFITYFYEGFRGENSTVLVDFNTKYLQKELTEEEKSYINKILKTNNSSNFNNDIFSSLQILMNEILKENYNQNYLIYNIIESLPGYIILNEQLIKLIKDRYLDEKEKSFTINSLFSIFEYFEDLCWDEIQKNIPPDYKLELPKNVKIFIFNYFNTIKLERKLITRYNLSDALRKLISRSIAGSRQEIDIKTDLKLKLYIMREDLWNQDILNEDLFLEEIDKIFGNEILVGHCYNLYKLIKNNDIKYEDLFKESEKNENDNEEEIISKKEENIDEGKNKKKLNEEDSSINGNDDDESKIDNSLLKSSINTDDNNNNKIRFNEINNDDNNLNSKSKFIIKDSESNKFYKNQIKRNNNQNNNVSLYNFGVLEGSQYRPNTNENNNNINNNNQNRNNNRGNIICNIFRRCCEKK